MKLLSFLILFSVQTKCNTDCITTLVDKAFDSKFTADYFLFIPVYTAKEQTKCRLMIQKENFKKYMIAVDSTFSNNDTLKTFLKEILLKKRNFTFSEAFYQLMFKEKGYRLLTKSNPLNGQPTEAFLKKYIINYSPKDDYLNLNPSLSSNEFPFVVENLFNLNYIVAIGDGAIGVFKINCK